MILLVLRDSPSYRRSRASALDQIDQRWGKDWTPEDLRAPRSRPFETNWRNRASYERAKMVRDGLLVADADGSWELSLEGQRAAQRIRDR
jgi:hypothetical protein